MEGVYVVVLGIIHTCIALRYKPAFTATQLSVGLAHRRPWFDPRPGQKVINIFFTCYISTWLKFVSFSFIVNLNNYPSLMASYCHFVLSCFSAV